MYMICTWNVIEMYMQCNLQEEEAYMWPRNARKGKEIQPQQLKKIRDKCRSGVWRQVQRKTSRRQEFLKVP